MKKLSLYVFAAFMMFAVIPAQLQAATEPAPTAMAATKPSESELADALNARLVEINEMDKSNLSASEKKELRKEVRDIKSELKALKGGVYLSVGAIIIVVLLLILLL
jgi:hypothetical protein